MSSLVLCDISEFGLFVLVKLELVLLLIFWRGAASLLFSGEGEGARGSRLLLPMFVHRFKIPLVLGGSCGSKNSMAEVLVSSAWWTRSPRSVSSVPVSTTSSGASPSAKELRIGLVFLCISYAFQGSGCKPVVCSSLI